MSDNVVGLAHFRISRSCVKYINLKEISKEIKELSLLTYDNRRSQKWQLFGRFPLLRYSASWASHAETVEKKRMAQADLISLFRWPSKHGIRFWAILLGEAKIPFLHFASQRGLLSVIEAMIDSGANLKLNKKDHYGQTPFSWAAREGHETVVRLLIERDDVDINSRDDLGRTPLSWAVRNGHEAIVLLLTERDDVVVNPKDHWGNTPLLNAVRNQHEAIVRPLIKRGDLDTNVEDVYGRRALSVAILSGHEAIFQLLIERGAEIDLRDYKGRTLLSYAAYWGKEAMVRLLIEQDDIDIDSKDDSGRTAFDNAVKGVSEGLGKQSIVKLLRRELLRRKNQPKG